jgi:hypothetical protein
VYLIVLWLCVAIWIPLGLGELLQALRRRAPRAAQIFSVAVIMLLLIRIPFTFPKVDLSTDTQAQEFIKTALEEIPAGAIVFVTGDEQTFSLWYAQFALQRREDVVVIAEGLLRFEWYNENLKHTYPLFSVPEKANLQPFDLMVANPDRRICYVAPDAIKCV